MSEELTQLFSQRTNNLPPWVVGKIPKHYKRLSVSEKEAKELATSGAKAMFKYFGVKLYFNQALLAGAILSDRFDDFVVTTPSQWGKAIEDNEPVLTKKGWKKHGDLKEGDEVISLDGNFVKVLAVSPKCEMDRRIVLESGDKIICHHNHEWLYKGIKGKRKEKTIRTLSVSEMEKRGLILPDGHRKFVVPQGGIVVGEEKELKVDPYVFGVWLGDGSTTKGQICSSKKDIAVLDECRKHYPNGSEWEHKDTGVITRSFIGLSNDLTEYGLCFQRKDTRKKYIPSEYLTASIDQRLKLLAGLIDTDGYTYHDKRSDDKSRTYFTTTDETLKDSFETLIATFGWRTSTVKIEPKLSTSGIQGKKPYWAIGFNPTISIPCVLKRKRPKNFSKQRGTGIVAIEKVSGMQGNCIQVEGGTYRVGKKLIPTHNSWLLGRVAILRAYLGRPVYIAGASQEIAQIIMQNAIAGLKEASDEIQNALITKKSAIDRLATSLSKTRVAFSSGGFVEAISLADTYQESLARNKALGKGGDYFVDEAALVSDKAMSEMGRRQFARTDGKNYQMVMISNPHNPGTFYDKLTDDNPPKNRFILWLDALTAVEEERFTEETVFGSDWAKNVHDRRRYLLCELDVDGDTMLPTPKIYEGDYEYPYLQYFLGLDAAYKGKDDITLALNAVDDEGVNHIDDILTITKGEWIDGVTEKQIIGDIAKIARRFRTPLVCADQGYGVWLINGLLDNSINCKGVNFGAKPSSERVKANEYAATNAQNIRAEMFLDLQNLIEDNMIEFSDKAWEKVKGVFPFIKSERKQNGKIQVIKKSEIKAKIGKSPDELDAVLLSIHAAIKIRAI